MTALVAPNGGWKDTDLAFQPLSNCHYHSPTYQQADLRPLYLWIFVVLIPLQIYRARQESKVLGARFGDEYRQYKSRSWF